ncbi:organic cation transporter protein-like isoform X2 [Thrips palmi]|uniref:Organic cation transporter protein-like isoform X2 n=1 Tax=Thrips palmi TaxID=161013 RepID=A0A6P8XVT0_THRPL|nr:organic cation transporter protein-like isoform X2 [Thrips palmi]
MSVSDGETRRRPDTRWEGAIATAGTRRARHRTNMISPEDVDRVLLQVGKFGRFQFINCLVVNMPIMFSALYSLAYVYTAQDLVYRCLVPECESSSAASAAFSPPWLPTAVPFKAGVPEPCDRFQPLLNATEAVAEAGSCSARFDTVPQRCGQWVYEPGQRSTLVNEWDLTCEDNKWKLSLVGTIGSVGAFISMPVSGFVSDRFGRKTLFVWAWVLASLSGIIQSFSSNFIMFLVFEFCNLFFEAGVYAAGFLLAMEFVGPKQRVLPTTVLSIFYSSGNAVLGGLAYAVRDWRWLLRAIYGGGLLFALPLWFTPESVRWLAAKGRLAEADAIVARVAAINKVAVGETLSSVADRQAGQASKAVGKSGESQEASTLHNLVAVFKSASLMIRFINCCYCWMANTFVYYGLSLNAATLSGDQYVNFILSGLVEIPANMLALWLQEAAGRRGSLAGTLIVAGASCLAFLVIPTDVQWAQILVYMLGKFAITISFCVIYVITAEMFPTNARNSMMSYGSTFGRVGTILAPQTPLLASIDESLPLTLFGVVSLSSGLLALLFPETRGRPLPETTEEAEKMTVVDCKTCLPCTT